MSRASQALGLHSFAYINIAPLQRVDPAVLAAVARNDYQQGPANGDPDLLRPIRPRTSDDGFLSRYQSKRV